MLTKSEAEMAAVETTAVRPRGLLAVGELALDVSLGMVTKG
jgi:hypothetical protein